MVRVGGPHQAVTSCQDQHAAAQAGDACHEQRLRSSLLVVSSRSNKSTGSHPLQQQVSSEPRYIQIHIGTVKGEARPH